MLVAVIEAIRDSGATPWVVGGGTVTVGGVAGVALFMVKSAYTQYLEWRKGVNKQIAAIGQEIGEIKQALLSKDDIKEIAELEILKREDNHPRR